MECVVSISILLAWPKPDLIQAVDKGIPRPLLDKPD
jgi:hypothetical protein